ncbi:histidine triad nucleotide-binding protein 3-like [Temnothorax curvispinosus]|uniref:Adenosine 5'-monophosphoramidase HINT3 n=2 Tax=Temnothorax TaxID=300110 RepID=A0A6J1PU66_9HYME|nr:histidine triad nucleotide-binding protein 3-like [Temnothorax curvispinosus]XP_024888620.1 histidine triad nucleotide-binding protein 3-like [Temnothorax curvispinosus]TGZ50197.1 Histidine triad nucleotide-binding protein 3 [Temnothorax longispinosus]
MAQQLTNCVFCKIIRDEEPGEKIYEDEDLTCIKDINPVSTHHYLILPKKHIRNAKTLQPEDSELYDKIVAAVDIISEKMNLDPGSTRTGFHWPPFNTVDHLHLHVISPIEKMNAVRKMMFNPNMFWFVSTDYVKSRLENCKL